MKRSRVLLLNLSAIIFHSSSKMAAKSFYYASINKMVSGVFNILIGCLDIHIKLE